MDIITLIVVGGVTYYLITSGTLDKIIQNLNLGGGGAAAAGGGTTTGTASGGYDSRNYKAPSGTRSSGSGYTTGGGSYGGGSPGWYTSGSNVGGQGHHHCIAHTAGCYCTDPPKCVSQGVPPTSAGECRPDFGTKSYLGGGPYPATADFSKCPAGTR